MPASTAFSLVEVVLAIGIITFGLIVLLGLLPTGIKSNRDSSEESQAVNLLYALVADRQATSSSIQSSRYSLPAVSNVVSQVNGILFATEDGVLTTNKANSRYRISYTIYPTTGTQQPVVMSLRVSWPALQTNQPATVETQAIFLP